MESHSNLNELQVFELLKELDQNQILEEYKNTKYNDEDRKKFIEQINHLEKIYPGGIREYVKRAKVLLDNSKNNINPYSRFKPSVPHGVNVKIGNENFYNLEKSGLTQLKDIAFVLVAGGLGERLGYDDIKIGIPSELVTKRIFFEVYVDYIKAYESRVRKTFEVSEDWNIPIIIMTSDDTHLKTVDLLSLHFNFGLRQGQIEIVKQEKVPALLDNDCHMALIKNELLIETKPHGHGDVHTLLHQHGVVSRLVQKNKKWLVFFQDTNALIFNVVPSAIGVSLENNFVVNSITIPRKPGEAVGAICKLTDEQTGRTMTLNVEYNQLDAMLKDKYNPQGDIPNEHGLSDFPGNINVLVFELTSYNETLKQTQGLMPEFVNPKYANEQKNLFKSPTRLECMMQDYPQLLEANEPVGFTNYDRWFCFSACKNNLVDGIEKVKKNLPPETAFSVEQDIFKFNTIVLKDILSKLEVIPSEKDEVEVLGHHLNFGPKIVLYSSFFVGLEELNNKIKNKITVTEASTLIVHGEETIIENLNLDGYLKIENNKHEIIPTKNLKYRTIKKNEGKNYEVIRGYTLDENQLID